MEGKSFYKKFNFKKKFETFCSFSFSMSSVVRVQVFGFPRCWCRWLVVIFEFEFEMKLKLYTELMLASARRVESGYQILVDENSPLNIFPRLVWIWHLPSKAKKKKSLFGWKKFADKLFESVWIYSILNNMLGINFIYWQLIHTNSNSDEKKLNIWILK